jgi:hypothetical protein
MNNSLIFYDKEGNALNFNYNETLERYEGDILFHENSNDTFKTQAIYMFEKINAFEYENKSDLSLIKWQLFNEFGFNFYNSNFTSEQIDLIEPVNLESTFYSKWISGDNFHNKFPLGTLIRFDSSIFEFVNTDRTFVVVGNKKNAILIISIVDNRTFNINYTWQNLTNYVGKTISSVDVLGIYNYVDSSTLTENLSNWNEKGFYNRIYKDKKLNIVNSLKNDLYLETNKYIDATVVTIKNENIYDIDHFEYVATNLPVNHDLWIEVLLKTDLPEVYSGSLTFHDTANPLVLIDPLTLVSYSYVDVLKINTLPIPTILKPGVQFKSVSVPPSLNDQTLFNVAKIPNFTGNANLINYVVGSQVLWNNQIKQCIQSYLWTATSSITPDDNNYWSNPTYLPLSQSPVFESITSDLYLTTDKLYFTQSFTMSSSVTLASAAEKFSNDLSVLNIELYYDSGQLHSDLIYPSKYAVINYYGVTSSFSTSSLSIGSQKWVVERAIEVEEKLEREFNYDFSENFSYNIVFSDLDDYGIIVKINKEVYQTDIKWVYTSGQIDMERTIDKTLRNWMTLNSVSLVSLGIISTLQTIDIVSPYYNSLNLITEYPNVPLQFEVRVGSTADFHIEKSHLYFYEPSVQGMTSSLGNYIDIRVNNISYGITHSLPQSPLFNSTISTTLQRWVEEYSDILDNYGILVDNLASSIKFSVKNQNQRCDVEVRAGQSVLPGDFNWKVVNKMTGNHGTLLTSNEIILATFSGSTQSLETEGFSTGMITGINGTIYPLQNVEYNILYLQPDVINLSYEGPFWGLTSSICQSSPFTIVAFSNGFTQSLCPPGGTGSGMFNLQQWSNDFNLISINSATYSVNTFSGITNMVDLIYVQSSNSIFVFGDNILVFDSSTSNQIATINLPSNSNSIQIIYNSVDNFVWALSQNTLWQIDPFSNVLVNQISLVQNASSLDFDRNTGYVYVATDQSVEIYNIGSLVTTIPTISYNGCYYLAFNSFEGDMYVTCRDGSTVIRIDGSLLTFITYIVSGLTSDQIIYDPVSEAIFVWGSNLNRIDSNVVTQLTPSSGTLNYLEFDPVQSGINLSTDLAQLSLWDTQTDTYVWSQSTSVYGFLSYNAYDGGVYLSNQDPGLFGIWTLSSQNGQILNSVILSAPTTQIISNPERNSVWAIQPSTNLIIEVLPSLIYSIVSVSSTYSVTDDNFYGSLSDEYNNRDYLWLHTRDFIRRPRQNFNGDPNVSLYWKWFSDNVPEFFMYDFSGDLLPTTGALAYTGPKPLTTIHLNRLPNRSRENVSLPQYQQTIFPVIENQISYVDDNDDLSIVPEPIECFIGFNAQVEGGLRSILQLFKKEPIDFTINTLNSNTDIISFETVVTQSDRYGLISLDSNSTSNFLSDSIGNTRGLKVGQSLAIFIKDESNTRNQFISKNNGYLVKIRQIFFKSLIVDFFKEVDQFATESTIITDYPKTGNTTYLSVRFKIWDKELGRFNVYGQTEIEDVRFKTELGNVGKLVSSDDVYIFKEYDIKEEGIDWVYLNRKRKEMLMMKNIIYPYIGSYKSIINAINYFGYNDLQLNEYYRNINSDSPNYTKLFKVEIPDIFDNTVEGWKENDFIKHTFPNDNYADTNLFNLTYRITDREGNNVLTYTLEEVQKKLQGLKYWLQKNIIPITHRILDITGRADFSGVTTISHIVRDVQVIKHYENFTPVSFKLNELYLMPVNNGSTVYNCVLDFYFPKDVSSRYPGISQSTLPDYYTIDIRTYEIYREWYAFKNYMIGDRVIYFDKLYESVIDNNKTNNPRKYENISEWAKGNVYNVSDFVKYEREFYIFTSYGFGTSSTASVISPALDSGTTASNWLNVTEWKEIDLLPIQRISERRRIDNLNPFNFTIDSNIDPYLVIEVSSENGYGSNYRDKKNYEIRGILDIRELESYTNLTSKQYTNSVIGIVYPS